MECAIQQVFDRLRAKRWVVAERSPADRVAHLERLKRAVLERSDALASAVHADFGRHPAETEIIELQPTIGELTHAIRHLPDWMRAVRQPSSWALAGSQAEIRYEPRGVVLILGPWNYPINLMLAPLLSAVAAGNCVVLKPSEKAPRTGEAVAALVASVFADDEVACVLGGSDVAEALLTLPFDHFFFSGSGAIGRVVMRAAAGHLASVTLELGGKSPVIVHEDAAIEMASERIAWGKFVNAGQTCIAPDYVLVHERCASAFVQHTARALGRLSAPSGSEQPSSLCRIVDHEAWQRLTASLDATVGAGARLESGGGASEADCRIEPTIVTHVTGDAPLMRDEIFGPILPVLTYSSLDEAIAFIRARPQPLALYVFSRSRTVFERVVQHTTAGGSVWNNVLLQFANPYLPFGGVGASGSGSYHGSFGFRAFSHERAILRQGRISWMKLFYPPYSARTIRRLKWVRRMMG